jgi:hypothetical protein
MTYPPQQPGPYGPQPGPYGPPPDGTGQPGVPGQYGQPGQPGQYGPPPGQYGQPPQATPGQGMPGPGAPGPGMPGPGTPGQPGQPGQPGLYGQPEQFVLPGQYGQPAAYGQQPGGFGDFSPPPKKRTGLIVGIVIAVVVLAGVGTGLYFLLGGKSDNAAGGGSGASDQTTPQGTANLLVGRLNAKDVPGVQSLTCTDYRDQVQGMLQNYDPRMATDADPQVQAIKVTYAVTGVNATSDTAATAAITESFANLPSALKSEIPSGRFTASVPLKKSPAAKWELCGAPKVSNPGGPDPSEGGDDSGGSSGSSTDQGPTGSEVPPSLPGGG